MDKFIQTAAQYGLSVEHVKKEAEKIQSIDYIIEQLKHRSEPKQALEEMLTYWLLLRVEDVKTFKKSFGISEEGDIYPDYFYKYIVVERDGKDGVEFEEYNYQTNVRRAIQEDVLANMEKYKKQDVEFHRMMKANPSEAKKYLREKLIDKYNELLWDQASKEKQNQFYHELKESLKQVLTPEKQWQK